MNIALINASPKFRESASGALLNMMKGYLSGAEVSEYAVHKPELSEDTLAGLNAAGAWVFLFPLYIDGIPSHLLSVLARIGEAADISKNKHIYAVVNLGFYEGVQADVSLEIMKNWCERCGFTWGGGAGLGGAGGLAYMPQMPQGKGPRAPFDSALEKLSETAVSRGVTENIYVSIGFPRSLYRLGGQTGWRKMIKANGLKKRDLGRKPELNE